MDESAPELTGPDESWRTATPPTPDDICPGCEADLRAAPVPSGAGFYTNRVGVQIRGMYDGVLFWQCPFCHHRWHAHPPGSRYRDRAASYVGNP